MNYRILGRTGLKVSAIGFGCWAIGGTSYGPTEDDESLAALEAAWAKGVNFYDTADTYGHGHSESLLAEFLKTKPRDQVILASKAGWDFYHGPSRKNFDPAYICFACNESLKRLGVSALDLYQLHNPSLAQIQGGETVGVLEGLKRQGKIRFIGISIHTEAEALAALDDGRVDSLQFVLNLLDQRMAGRVLPLAREKNIGVIVREPLACGVLSGKYRPDHVFHKGDHRRRWQREKLEEDMVKIDKIKALFASPPVSLTRLALEYVLHFEEVSTVIPGAKTPAQVLENIQAVSHPMLRPEDVGHLRELYERAEVFRAGLA